MKRSVVVLSIFFTLSLGAMEESAAASPASASITKEDPRAWEDFTLDKFDKIRSIPRFLIQTNVGRSYLMKEVAQKTIILDGLISPDHAAISAIESVFVYSGYNRIISGNYVIIFCENLARLEAFIKKESKKKDIHTQRELETARRNHLILLSLALKFDKLECSPSISLQDLPKYFNKKWPPKNAIDGIYSRLSSHTIVTSALEKRVKYDTDRKDELLWGFSNILFTPEEYARRKLKQDHDNTTTSDTSDIEETPKVTAAADSKSEQ